MSFTIFHIIWPLWICSDHYESMIKTTTPSAAVIYLGVKTNLFRQCSPTERQFQRIDASNNNVSLEYLRFILNIIYN